MHTNLCTKLKIVIIEVIHYNNSIRKHVYKPGKRTRYNAMVMVSSQLIINTCIWNDTQQFTQGESKRGYKLEMLVLHSNCQIL